MRLMFIFRDNHLGLLKIVIEECQYIRWHDEPLRITKVITANLIRIPKGTVMPKYWLR